MARPGHGGAGNRPRAGLRLGTQGVGEERPGPRLPSAQERTGRAAADLLPQDSDRRRQDPARDEGGGPRQHPLPEAADGARAVDRPHHADLQPDAEGPEGPRPPLPPAARHGVRRTDADAGEDQRLRPAGRAGEPVRAAADAAVGQPGDAGAAPDVPRQRRLRPLLPPRTTTWPLIGGSWTRCRTSTPSSRRAASGDGMPRPPSATPSACSGRSSSSTKATRRTAATPGRRWKVSTPA